MTHPRCSSCEALRANIVEQAVVIDREVRINARLSFLGVLVEGFVSDGAVSDARFRHLIRAQVDAWRDARNAALEERTGRAG